MIKVTINIILNKLIIHFYFSIICYIMICILTMISILEMIITFLISILNHYVNMIKFIMCLVQIY